MQRAAIGFRVHSGWAAMVAVALEDGLPVVLDRRKLLLVKTFTYTFRQPYHTAEKMALSGAAEFVRGAEKESQELALSGICSLKKELAKLEYRVCGAALLLASGRQLPEFEKILASHALIHTADGELFREALSRAGKRCGVETVGIKEKELLEQAKQALRVQPTVLLRRVTELGKPFGSPWSQDEKFATLATWLALSGVSKSTNKFTANLKAAHP